MFKESGGIGQNTTVIDLASLFTVRVSMSHDSADSDDLVAVSERFCRMSSMLFELIPQLDLSTYEEGGPSGVALYALQLEWRKDMAIILRSTPQTVRGALAKQDAALAYFGLMSSADVTAETVLYQATCTLNEFRRRSCDQDQIPDAASYVPKVDLGGFSSVIGVPEAAGCSTPNLPASINGLLPEPGCPD